MIFFCIYFKHNVLEVGAPHTHNINSVKLVIHSFNSSSVSLWHLYMGLYSCTVRVCLEVASKQQGQNIVTVIRTKAWLSQILPCYRQHRPPGKRLVNCSCNGTTGRSVSKLEAGVLSKSSQEVHLYTDSKRAPHVWGDKQVTGVNIVSVKCPSTENQQLERVNEYFCELIYSFEHIQWWLTFITSFTSKSTPFPPSEHNTFYNLDKSLTRLKNKTLAKTVTLYNMYLLYKVSLFIYKVVFLKDIWGNFEGELKKI